MRKVLIVTGGVVILVILAAVVFVATINPNDYRGTIQEKLEQQLGRKVALGNMDLRLFPLSFRVGNLSISDDPMFNNSRPFIQTEELSVSVRLLPLLSKSVQIDSLSLQRPPWSWSRMRRACGTSPVWGENRQPRRRQAVLQQRRLTQEGHPPPVPAGNSNYSWMSWQSTTDRLPSPISRNGRLERSTITLTSNSVTSRLTRPSISKLRSSCPARGTNR